MATLALPLAISGISALAGIFGNRQKQQTMEQTQTRNTNNLTAPEYDPQTMSMRNTLMNYYLDRLGSQDDFYRGYTQSGIRNINQTSDASNEAINNLLASRGMGRTTAGANSLIGNRLNQANQQSNFLNQVPLMADQRFGQNLQQASQFFQGLPVGQRQTGTETSTIKGTQTTPGNMLGGGLASLGTTLGGLYGQGAFSNPYQYSGGGAAGSYPNLPTTGVGSGQNIGYRPPNIPY